MDGTSADFNILSATAASVRTMKHLAAVGLMRARIVFVMKGGMGVTAMKKTIVVLTSLIPSTSVGVGTFLRVSQLGTSISLVAKIDYGLNLSTMADLPEKRPKFLMVWLTMVPPVKAT